MPYAILIVDDSLPMRSVIKRTIKAAGYGNARIFEAENGEQGLGILKSNWIDLILSDYNMPVMNGLEFLKSVQADDLYKDIPFIVVSTEGHALKIKEFMNCGAFGYITKPFTAEEIRDLIVKHLGETDYEQEADDSDDGFDF